MRIELEARDQRLNSELMMDMEQDRDDNGLYPGGATISFPIAHIQESVGFPEVFSVVVSFAGQAITTVAPNLLSNWFWEKFTKHKVKRIQIDGLDIHLNDKGEFERILAKKITIEVR